MQVVFGVSQVHNILAVQAVLGNARGARRRLLQTHAILIIIEINCVAVSRIAVVTKVPLLPYARCF